MKAPKLILEPLEKALASLEKVLKKKLDPIVRDSAIQRFEYTYELSYKTLKKFLRLNLPSATEVEDVGFKDLMRLGFENGLIRDPLPWFEYREKRNMTSHAYDEKKAQEVYDQLANFAVDARHLLKELKKHASKL